MDLEGKFWGKHKFLFELYFGVWGIEYCSLEKYIYKCIPKWGQWWKVPMILKKQRGKKCMMFYFTLSNFYEGDTSVEIAFY